MRSSTVQQEKTILILAYKYWVATSETLGKYIKLPNPQFLHFWNDNNNLPGKCIPSLHIKILSLRERRGEMLYLFLTKYVFNK